MLVPLLSSMNSVNLATFICHLVIGGQFHGIQVLYHPVSSDGALLSEIQKICPNKFYSSTIDITQPWNVQWEFGIISNNFIQLIFPGLHRDLEIERFTFT